MEEIWKDLEEDYLISNLGKVKSLKCGKEKILKPIKKGKYCFKVTLTLENNSRKKDVFPKKLIKTMFV
jgi:hypothetical protein